MGDPGLPVIGHTIEFLDDGLRHARRYYERFGTVFWVNTSVDRWVQVIGPAGLETVLVNRDRAFSNKLGWDPLIGAFFDRGVMLMDFEEHRHHRRIMQQAFKHERLVAYLEKMNPAIQRGIARWQSGSGFELYRAAKQLTLDIATEVFVGAQRSPEADRLNAAFIDVVLGGRRSSALTCRAGNGIAGWRAGACSSSTSTASCRPSGRARATTCSASCAEPRPRTASASATRMSSTT